MRLKIAFIIGHLWKKICLVGRITILACYFSLTSEIFMCNFNMFLAFLTCF